MDIRSDPLVIQASGAAPKHDDFSTNRHPALAIFLRDLFGKPVTSFQIML
jgi:hypothetical protein